MQDFTQFIKQTFEARNDSSPFETLRKEAFTKFCEQELPTKKIEQWRHKAIDKLVEPQYALQSDPLPYIPIEKFFKCNVQNINTQMFAFLNGWFVHDNQPLLTFENGIIVGTILEAVKQYPELVLQHFSKIRPDKTDGLIALNEALFSDGIFIYIPDNVRTEMPIQVVSLIESEQNLMLQHHNLIVMGKNATLSFIQCDDSLRNEKSFINNVTEIFMDEYSQLDYYKMENKSSESLLANNIYINQQANSQFFSNVTTFNGGYVRNNIHVEMNGEYADAKLYGLYLVDRKQYVDNQVEVIHNQPNTSSNQLYKGIADDEAGANFNGHVIVKPHAQGIAAYQINKNIALTDDVKITTHPFLEIYADDVKCSHGATIGQLDEEAMFYLRSRGICKRNARMLLMYAFANNVADYVKIPELRNRLNEMIQKRLSGELSICDQCILHCSNKKSFDFEFKIKPFSN